LSKSKEDKLSDEEQAEIRKHLAPWRQELLKITDRVEKEKQKKEEADRKTKKTRKGLTGLTS
jgi:hypothetical protein